jgi:Cu/Ag efflux protein CusF
MRKFVLPLAAAAFLAGTVGSYAAVMSETGVIAQIDAKAPTITLKSGKVKTFWLDKSINPASLKVGEKVKVSYDMMNKKPVASAVSADH